MSFNLLRAILSSPWAMEPSEAERYLPLVARLISGDANFTAEHDPLPSFNVQGAVMAQNAQSFSPNERKGVTAIIPISGPILKYSAMCGPRGLDYYSEILNWAINSPDVNSILYVIDSGGGQTSGIQSFTALMASTSKPSLALIHDGVGASAAYWISSAATHGIWASSANSVIGSIGTMITIADMRGKLEKDGIKLHDIYATASKNKNKDFKDAIDGNYKPIRSELLDPINENFLNAIKTSRGEKITDEEVYSGKIYMATEAIKNGLIDRIGSVQEAVNYLQEQVEAVDSKTTSKSNQSSTNNSSKMKFKSTWNAILAATGFGSVTSEEEAPMVTEERLEQLNSSLEAANSKVTDLEGQIATLQGDLSTTKATLATAEKDRDDFKAKAEKFGKQAGSAHTPPKKDAAEGGNTEMTAEEEAQAAIDALPHNRALDGNPNFN